MMESATPVQHDAFEYQKMLGERIRRFRRERSLTQMDLAKQVGVTNGQISTIERGLSAPSIGTLKRISEAMGVPMVQFFERPEARDIRVVRKSERKRLTSPNTPEVLEILAGSRLLSAMQVGLGPEQSCRRPGHDSPSEVIIVVQQGSIELESDEQKVPLKAGDSARLDGRALRVYRCLGDAPALVLEVRGDQTGLL
jgi:transcriptional regulator with XRE-family HTH domain